ncbi:beta-lactamase family protein [Telmatocola sphagniphila]|uniref:Beta-lactamase family protein n=1 Tax=Telmatocola sphagniphila TaxID=1123043 RepID=A0A8E6B8S5_9BACT|nr:serine hydrolase domain-containing protein [Telmatocola sphagniphila]QVL33988.1 beta-lactamase family protein [Telmatocola sphagniphila]
MGRITLTFLLLIGAWATLEGYSQKAWADEDTRNRPSDELPQANPKDVGLSAEKLERVKTLVQGVVDKKQTAGVVVLIARHGKVAYLETFGKMNALTGQAMRPDAIFRIHSMSKPITTAAALLLYEEGKYKLDDPVSKYLPEFKGLRVHTRNGEEVVAAKREMTIRDLMRHTSGLTYGMPNGTAVDKMYIAKGIDGPNLSLAEMVSALGKLPLQDQPGTQFNYSVSTDVLARLIEVLSGKPIDEFLKDRVCRPLDMRDTDFIVPDDKLARFTANHGAGDKGMLKVIDDPATSRYRTRRKYLSGGGGLVSTARDYARFCQMLLQGGELQGCRLLRPETVSEMTSNQLPIEALPMKLGGFPLPGMGFGLGLSVRLDAKSVKPDPAAGEFGWNGAASTYFWVAPKSEMVVIVLQQVQPYNFTLQMSLKSAIYGAIEN